MKILEILEDRVKIHKPQPGPTLRMAQYRQRKKSAASTGEPELGSGFFGKVYPEMGTIEFAVKLSDVDQKRWDLDGYYAYLQALNKLDDSLQNPYLPRIEEVEPVESALGPYLRVTMERLYALREISEQEARQVYKKIAYQMPRDNDDASWNYKLTRLISNIFWNTDKTQDPQFEEVINLVKELGDRYSIDMHEHNFMFRRTPYGVQLVITDPLAFGKQRAKTRRLPNPPSAPKPSALRDPQAALGYAKYVVKGPWPMGEPIIAQDPHTAYTYALDFIKGPWPMGEAAIATDSFSSLRYAKYVVKGRWPPGEAAIAQDSYASFVYARDIVEGRWPPGEAAIAQDGQNAFLYALHIIKGRWKPGEPAIRNDRYVATDYQRFLKSLKDEKLLKK